jgi:ubiquinone/menaquinone biosynthesis C-methylase UbiE
LARARRRRAAGGAAEADSEPTAPAISSGAQKRAEIAQGLWGDGLSSPYNSGLTDVFLQPIEIEKDQEFLEIGAGLGGCADKLSEKLGIRITALENNKDYLEYLEAQKTVKPKGYPVTFGPFVPEVTEFRPRAYHAALIKDTLFQVADKEGFLKKIKDTLRARAHLVVCDFVLRDKGIESAATDAWAEQEPSELHPISVGEQLWNFRASGFHPVTQKDITELYLDRIKGTEPRIKELFLVLTKNRPIDKEFARILLEELSLWLSRAAALKSGDLRIYYFHVVTKELSRKMALS